MTSDDGLSWSEQSMGTQYGMNSMVWTGRQLVAVGDLGLIYTSPDGNRWKYRPKIIENNLYSVCWTDSLLIAVGTYQGIITAPEDPPVRTSSHSGGKAVTPGTRVQPLIFSGNGTIPIDLRAFQNGTGITLGIFTVSGRRIFESENITSPVYHLDSSVLLNGRYFLQIKGSGTAITYPLLIVR